MTSHAAHDRAHASRRLTTCAAAGCGRAISEPLLMCLDHWRMVPSVLRREIWAAYDRRRRRESGAVEAHLQAIAHAVDAVRDKQLARGARRAGGSTGLF